ncbi:MAG TPA: methyltransferase domain-containing protein, partial [Anaerolineae bacterium]|nr:methyltransferase domain-containing protein [Anaerolineae bacterium]
MTTWRCGTAGWMSICLRRCRPWIRSTTSLASEYLFAGEAYMGGFSRSLPRGAGCRSALQARGGLMGEARMLLRRYGLRPHKRLGQHFLVSEAALARIVDAAELVPGEAVLEVGAGLGTLTRALAARAGLVVAVELDRRLIPVLREELAGFPNVRLIQGDILALDPAQLMEGRPYKVVANLPYAITSVLLRHLLEAQSPPRRMVVTVQREVAERIVAR